MIQIDFKYKISDKVFIKDIEMCGHVTGLCQDINGQQYQVVYWNEGIRNVSWLFDWEIDNVK